jgi:hypothetical protein
VYANELFVLMVSGFKAGKGGRRNVGVNAHAFFWCAADWDAL